jgi:Protein kinase domain/Sulfatase-modifying factor enzyme 1
MTNANPMARIRAALEALERGASTVESFESALTAALASGAAPADEVAALLRPAAERGVLPFELLSRVGGAAARGSQATRLRAPGARSAPAETRVAASPGLPAPESGTETRFRPASAPPAPVEAAPRVTSEWLEPQQTASAAASAEAAAEAAEVATGRTLGGRYLLERKLGEGGMGVVYFASDQEVKGENFAVKVLKSEIREHPEALALLREEVRKTRALSHPNIVGVYSLNSDGDCVYMLMEYLEGKPLDALIDEDFGRGIPFERAWPLIQDVGTALAYAHDHSVIHSDLKPTNIFVTTSGKAKLVDFGIARAARGRPRGVDPAALGALTPAYASCEMLEGHEPDSRDDIYALACVFYEMLSGKHPFGGRTAVEAREEKRKPPPLAALSRAQNAALAQALSFDREQRTASVEGLIAGLAPRPAAPRRTLLMASLAAVIVAAIAGGAWWVRSGSTHREAPGPTPSTGAVPASVSQALKTVRELAERAHKLEVDEADPSLVQGTQRLHSAEQQIAAGAVADGGRLLTGAESALRAALSGGARVAHIGSPPDEVAFALGLCQSRGEHCTPSDFADEAEEAQRTVLLHPFELDATAVTNGEFARFADTQGYKTAAERGRALVKVTGSRVAALPGETWKSLRDHDAAPGADTADYPVRGIDFDSAKDYCASLGKRLPTEEEWEYVARPDHRIFPWGNDPAMAKTAASARLLPAGEQASTGRFGNRGLGGVLWEWVDGGTATERVFRGASWLDADPLHQRLAMRGLENPERAHVDTGFRCARSVNAWPAEPAAAGAQAAGPQ